MTTNLQPNSSFESATAAAPASLTTCTSVLSSTEALQGTQSCKVTLTSTTFNAAWSSTTQSAMRASVAASTQYTASAWVWCAGTGRSIILGIAFFDSTGVTFKNSASGTAVTLTANTWTRVTCTATSGAGSGSATLSFGNNGAWTNGDIFYVDEMQIETGASASGWVPGPSDITQLLDAGVGVDTVTVTHGIVLSDVGVAVDGIAVAATVPLGDSGVGVDGFTGSSGGTTITESDVGAGSDQLTVTVTVPLLDPGTGVDRVAIAATVPLSGTGSAADSLTAGGPVNLSDTGTGVDGLSVPTVTLVLSDTGTGADTITVPGAAVPANPVGTYIFQDNFPDTNGSAWPAQWTTSPGGSSGGGSATQNGSNAGNLVTGVVGFDSAYRAVASGMTSITDQELLVRWGFQNPIVNQYLLAYVRGNDFFTQVDVPFSGYYLQADIQGNSVQLGVDNLGTRANLASAASKTFTAGTDVWVRLRAQGTTIQWKIWNVGAAEPGVWDQTVTDSTLPAGVVGLSHTQGANSSYTASFRNVTVDNMLPMAESPTGVDSLMVVSTFLGGSILTGGSTMTSPSMMVSF